MDQNIKEKYGLKKTVVPVCGCRNIGKKDMKLNDATPKITVNPETYEVCADGVKLESKPAETLPPSPIWSNTKRLTSSHTLNNAKYNCIDSNKAGEPCKRERIQIKNVHHCYKQIGKTKLEVSVYVRSLFTFCGNCFNKQWRLFFGKGG